jgi:predicted transcriptional regulator
MDVLYRLGQATAAEVMKELPDPPSYSAVRATLRILEEKGQVRHEEEGPRYVFKPAVARDRAKRTAVRHLISTFFDGSPEAAMQLFSTSPRPNSRTPTTSVEALIDEAKTKEIGNERSGRIRSLAGSSPPRPRSFSLAPSP